MSTRKIKVNGNLTKFAFDKTKKYKYDSSGDLVEATTISDDDIVLSGSKSSLRRMADMERNISILATKTVTSAGALDVSIGEVSGLQTALNAKASNSSVTSEASARASADTGLSNRLDTIEGAGVGSIAKAQSDAQAFATSAVNAIVSNAPAAYDTLNEIRNAMATDAELSTAISNISNVPSASKWQTARTLSLTGDASGSVSFDGSSNASLSVTVANNSHTHNNYVQKSGDTMTGNLTVNNAAPSIHLNDNSDTTIDVSLVNDGESFYIVETEDTAGIQAPTGGRQWFKMGDDTSGVIDILLANGAGTNKVFHDGYHPNADKWTTARTLSLTGDASGSVSWDGSSNASISVTVNNDSHNHNHSDGGFTVNGVLAVTSDIDVGAQVGTWLQSDVMEDAIGWNTQYGVYIGSTTLGYNSYIRGNGTFTNNTGTHTLWHSGNDGVGSGLDANSVQGYTPQETPVNNSLVKRDGNGNIQVNYLNATRINNTDVKEGNFTVGGDANTYYPVTWWGGDQDAVTEIEIFRSYSSTAPSTWNTSTHKGGLTFRLSTNFGGWGGALYDETVWDFRQTYSNMVADYTRFGNQRGFCIWLRGGGAVYNYKIKGRSVAPVVTLTGTYDPGGDNTGVTSRTDSPHTNINNNFIVTKNNGHFTASVSVSGDITATGDITAYSDDSLKTNVQVIDNALSKVGSIRGVTFDRIEDGSTSTGVIAQELLEVLPEAVKTDDHGVHSVAYGNITGLLIEAVKELTAQVEELKNK